jgi:hypothetical protein
LLVGLTLAGLLSIGHRIKFLLRVFPLPDVHY